MLAGNITEDGRKYSGSMLFLGIGGGIWLGFWKAGRICITQMQK